MNNANALAVFIASMNICYSIKNCKDCVAYDKNKGCYYYSPFKLLPEGSRSIINVYVKEHIQYSCINCGISRKYDNHNVLCVYDQLKILYNIKNKTRP